MDNLIVLAAFLGLTFFIYRLFFAGKGRSTEQARNNLEWYSEELQLVEESSYRKKPVMNRSEAKVLKHIIIWLSERREQNIYGEKVLPQVPMGAFLSSESQRSYDAIQFKRPDFLIVDKDDKPICVVEFNGPRHAEKEIQIRDRIKAEALASAGIPLVYIVSGEEHNYRVTRDKLNSVLYRWQT